MGVLADHPETDAVEATVADVDVRVGADEALFERMYRQHGGPLFQYLLRLTFGDHWKAEDFLQETLLRAWRKVQAGSLDMERVRPWLHTVARRIVIDSARARRSRPTEVVGSDVDVLPSSDDDIDRLLVTQTMRRGLMSLGHNHRRVIVEVFYNDRCSRETAELLRIPEGTVKSRTFYALRALRTATEAAWLGERLDDVKGGVPH